MRALNRIISYFDLQSGNRGKTVGLAAGNNLTVIPQYIALVLGIIVQPFLATYQARGAWDATASAVFNQAVFAIITGVLIFPGVYRKSFDDQQPKFVQWCTIVTAGIGWKMLLGAATRAALGAS